MMALQLLFVALALLSFANAETETWCDPILGCLELTDEWTSSSRPFNTLPRSRENINTRFYLHTQEVPSFYEDVIINAEDLTTIAESSFDPSKPIKFVVHGFVDTGFKNWVYNLADALLSYGDYNVIRVDWGGGSLTDYSQACANCRVVGLEIAYLVNTLIETYQIEASNVHLLGHSLGSHISGYAGEGIVDLGRITGLDPAGPYFTGTEAFIRLDPTDAVFVDAIHTDADTVWMLGWGTAESMGNIDFFPNAGYNQPGCDPVEISIDSITADLVNGARDIVACSHNRAINFFQETLTGASCPWVSHECTDYNSYSMGQCPSCGDDNSNCAYMGIRADEYVSPSRTMVPFFLDTDEDEPFCLIHYNVKILTAYPKDAEEWVMGNIKISLYGSNGGVISDYMITDKHEEISHGTTLSFLMTTHEEIGSILRIELEWNYNDTINPGTYCWNLVCNKSLYIQSVEVSPSSAYPETERLDETKLGCSTDASTTQVKDGHSESFLESTSCTTIS